MLYARGTRPQHSCQSIHSALIHHHPSNSSIIVLTVFTRPQASADAPVCVRAPISSRLKLELRKLARVYESRAPEFLSLQNAAPRCLTSPVGFNRPIISQSLFLNFSCANPATPLAQDHLLGVWSHPSMGVWSHPSLRTPPQDSLHDGSARTSLRCAIGTRQEGRGIPPTSRRRQTSPFPAQPAHPTKNSFPRAQQTVLNFWVQHNFSKLQ